MNINDYLELVNKDQIKEGSYDRYPVRFLSLNYDEGTASLIVQLQNRIKNVDIIDIKDYLPGPDGWITSGNLVDIIKKLKPKRNYILIGFSEYARFLNQNEFISLIVSLLEVENNPEYPKRRIYIPCFALYSVIKKTLNDYHRRKNSLNPLLNETDIEDLPRVYFLDSSLSIDLGSNEINSSSEWFGLWRDPSIDVTKPIICTSPTLAYFYTEASPSNVYNIRYLKDYGDVLQQMYGIMDLVPDKNNKDNYYKQLIQLLDKNPGSSFENIVLHELNSQTINTDTFYSTWKTGNKFNRWLLKNYILRNNPEETYLHKIVEKIDDFDDNEIINVVYTSAFEFKDTESIKDRKIVLSSIKKLEKEINLSYKITSYFRSQFDNVVKKVTAVSYELQDFKEDDELLVDKGEELLKGVTEQFLPYLTDTTKFERDFIIWLLRQQMINKECIQSVYPNLYKYIDYYDSGNKYRIDADGYFNQYRDLRLSSRESTRYSQIIHQYNGTSELFYSWYLDSELEYPEVLLKKNSQINRVHVLDGVGAEFTGYLIRLLENLGYSIEDVSYCKSHLPSITEVAGHYYADSYIWDRDYDTKVIHGDFYYHVDNLERSLSIIADIINNISIEEGDGPFAITADHGASVGHKLDKKEKAYNYDKSEHDGRCWHIKESQFVPASDDYLDYVDENDDRWIISLNQQSLYNNSKYMVHGGATPEEVIVPVIVASKSKKSSKRYKVRANNLKVSGLQKTVDFKIIPELEKGTKAMLLGKDGTRAELQYNETTKTWNADLNRGIKQPIEVRINDQKFSFETVPTVKMGDDLFDD